MTGVEMMMGGGRTTGGGMMIDGGMDTGGGMMTGGEMIIGGGMMIGTVDEHSVKDDVGVRWQLRGDAGENQFEEDE